MPSRLTAALLLAIALPAQQWSSVSAPSIPRSHAGVTYQVASGRTLLFGGRDVLGQRLNDAWEFDGTSWQVVIPGVSPSPRMAPSLTYDIARARVVLFGGAGPAVSLSDTWEFDGAHWQQMAVFGPLPRNSAALTYDSVRRQCVLFGGSMFPPAINFLDDTWEYDGTQWRAIAPIGASPSARSGSAMVYDVARGRTVLFGGVGAGTFGDTWEYDGVAWTAVAGTGPAARQGASMVFDAQRGRAVLFGGRNLQELADLWEYDGAWQAVATANAPAARNSSAMAYDLRRGRTILIGGFVTNGGQVLGDARELAPAATASWTRYGIGCNGSHGTPTLGGAPGSQPQLGSTFVLHLGQLPVPPAIAFLAFGFDLARVNGAPLPLALDSIGMPGCNLWVDVAAQQTIALPNTGTAIAALAIPAAASLRGTVVGGQALVLDVANGLTISNGIVLRVN